MIRMLAKSPKIALCRECHGTGFVHDAACPQCGGSGRVTVSARLELDIRPYRPKKQEG